MGTSSSSNIFQMKHCFWAIFLLFCSLGKAEDTPSEMEEQAKPPLLDESGLYAKIINQENSRIFSHKPVYFAYGDPYTKVQLSFRSALVEKVPLYFGYTQVIFWELKTESKPFLDATYNPEFLYRFAIKDGPLKSADIGIWEHQSNGKAGQDSRSFDQAYVRGNYVFETKRWMIEISGKLSYIYNNDETNADILTYFGPLDLQIKFVQLYSGIIDKGELSFKAHPAGKYANRWPDGGYELSYNFRLGGVKIVPSFYIQYFTGYGETLLTYNKKENQFRAGLLF